MARWLDDGITPNGAQGCAFGERGVHGFDLTFCAPKSVSLVRVLRADYQSLDLVDPQIFLFALFKGDFEGWLVRDDAVCFGSILVHFRLY